MSRQHGAISDMSTCRRWYLDFRVWFGLRFLEQPPHREHMYRNRRPQVVNIGLGQILKMNSSPEEVAALLLLRKDTSIPVPQLVGAWCRRGTYHDPDQRQHTTCIVLKRIPGRPVGSVYKEISKENMQEIVTSVRVHVEELRRFEQPITYDGRVCSLLGYEIVDPGLTAFGPVKPMSPSAFVDYLMNTYIEDRQAKEARFREVLTKANAKGLFFTHGDLHPHNIIVHKNPVDKRYYLTGLIDWTTAAWFPIYWEAYKAQPLYESFWDQWIVELTGDHRKEVNIVQELYSSTLRW